ncbi:amidohydrolase [Guptibacillus hwajinpoensis]|uniref:amidohydrolase n=1 Tax=Guptibacillus hwajinpoensis TaxID=208199 RepID=UPI001CFEE4F2|nr:amidohydrolase [Pseudalkalibacillus hwajinpoensis]WLR60092.1 amidohydrolase [Pseudalkalibacillus hwajinpoensis]
MNFVEENHDKILKTYQELHQLAEPSWQEEKTAHYLKEKLAEVGYHIQNFQGHFGFVAEFKGKKANVIALRADMDALVQEVEGVVKPNHSCGHDAHSTMVLFAALSLIKEPMQHTIRFIFQPAEEMAEGALKMIEENVLKDVIFLAGIHLRPAMEISYGKAAPIISHGSTTSIKGWIKGVPSHAARPETGNNPLEAAAVLIQEIQRIRLNVPDPFSVKITELHGGEASNSIPVKARFTLDLRSRSNETMKKLIDQTKYIISKVGELTETEIASEIAEYSPAAVKNDLAITLARKAIASSLGANNVVDECVSPGAEDFHFYSLKYPHLTATMIGLGCDLTPGLHHPDMQFNKEALIDGTKILIQLLLEADQYEW